MLMNVTKSAVCCVCNTEKEVGIVAEANTRGDGSMYVESNSLNNFSPTASTDDKHFICEDCLRTMPALRFLQFCKDDFKRPLSPEVVISAVNHLIEEKGYTTTLDVKNKLREEGYYALQEVVSTILKDALLEGDLGSLYKTYVDNGKNSYFEYHRDEKAIVECEINGYFLHLTCYPSPSNVKEAILSLINFCEDDFDLSDEHTLVEEGLDNLFKNGFEWSFKFEGDLDD